MKKILFASTAMVAFAGTASADVTLTGFAEMGLFVGDGGVADTGGDIEFFTDIDVTFTMAGETDGGLIFGASIDLDEGGDGSEGSDDNSEDGGAEIFISGAFGTVTMGDTDGALDWALTEVNFASGSINDDETEHGGFSGNSVLDGFDDFDGQILRYDFSQGNFGVAASIELDDSGDEENFAFGGRYELDFAGTAINLGIGYQDAGPVQAYGFSAAANLANGLSVGVNYTEFDDLEVDGGDVDRHFGVGVGYVAGAISASINYGIFDGDDGDNEGIGVSAGYDLGGGASLQAGYGHTENDNGDDFDTFSFGVRMNF